MSILLFLSQAAVPLVIFYIVGFGILQKRPVLDDFLDGAKKGMGTVVSLMPTLVGLLTAAGVLRASGFLDFISGFLAVPAQQLRIPASIIPVTLVRLVSNAAATSLVLDIFQSAGPDSLEGMMASILMSSTETVFYCLSVYFGAARIFKTRYALSGALIATGAGVLASILIAGKVTGM